MGDEEEVPPKDSARKPPLTRVTSRASARRSANVLVDDVVDLLSKALISPSSPVIACGDESVKAPTYDSLMQAVSDRLVLDTPKASPGQRAAHSLLSLGRSTSVLSPTTLRMYLEAVFTGFDAAKDLSDVINTIESVADVRLKLGICCACAQFRNGAAVKLLVNTKWLSETGLLDCESDQTVLGAIISGPLGLSFFASADAENKDVDNLLVRLKVLIESWIHDQIVPDLQLSTESRAIRRRIIYEVEYWAFNPKMIMAWADYAVAAAWSRQDVRLRYGIKPIIACGSIDGCVAQLMRMRSSVMALLTEISSIKEWSLDTTSSVAVFLWLPAENGCILFGRQCTQDAIRSVRVGDERSKISCTFNLEREIDAAVQAARTKIPMVSKTSADPQRMHNIVNSNLCFDVECLDDVTYSIAKRVQHAMMAKNVFLHTVLQEVAQHKTATVAGLARFNTAG